MDYTNKNDCWGDFLFIDEDFSRAEPQSAPQNATSVIGDPAEQDSQEEGERQYRMYQSDRKGTEGTRGDSREH